MLTIERCDLLRGNLRLVKASDIDTDAIRMRAGDIKRLNAANLAKLMFSFMRIEGIGCQHVFTLE